MSTTLGAQALRFAAVGVLNTAVGLSVILVSMAALGLSDLAANALGYACGLAVSFVVNRTWTFKAANDWSHSLRRFLLVFAGAYALNVLALHVVRDFLHLNSYLAQVAAMATYTVAFFAGSRIFAFPSSRRSRS